MNPTDWEARSSMGERRDCTVRALVALSGRDYGTVYKVFADHGRKKGEGVFLRKIIHSVGAALDLKFRNVKRGGSLEKLIRRYPTGKLAVTIRHHAFAVIDGKISDDSRPGSHVKMAWLVV